MGDGRNDYDCDSSDANEQQNLLFCCQREVLAPIEALKQGCQRELLANFEALKQGCQRELPGNFCSFESRLRHRRRSFEVMARHDSQTDTWPSLRNADCGWRMHEENKLKNPRHTPLPEAATCRNAQRQGEGEGGGGGDGPVIHPQAQLHAQPHEHPHPQILDKLDNGRRKQTQRTHMLLNCSAWGTKCHILLGPCVLVNATIEVANLHLGTDEHVVHGGFLLLQALLV